MDSDSPVLEQLSRDECLRLMNSVPVGRIVYTRQALPAVELLNCALVDGDIVIRTHAAGKLAAATRGTVVAFEADCVDLAGHAGWSVTVVGQARAVTDGREIHRLEGGNFATPWRALAVLDGTLARYRLFALNAQAGIPARPGVTLESPFVGPCGCCAPRLHSRGGQAIIALPSWPPRADVSTVVPAIRGPVTSFQHSYIVSEQGAAVIWGHDAAGQAEQIIEQVAQPSVREQLRAAADSFGLGL